MNSSELTNTWPGFKEAVVRVCEELETAAGLLTITERGIPDDPSIAQLWYLRELMKAMAGAAQDLALLVRHERYQNGAPVCRVGFEARINLGAACRVRDFAAQKLLGDTQESCRTLRQ